jgi:alanine racemase
MPNLWIEIDEERLARNVRAFREHVGPDTSIAAVVKSNGYGHGLEQASRAFCAGGADWLSVHSFAEAERLRSLDLQRPILLTGPLAAEERTGGLRAGYHLTISNLDDLRAVSALARSMGERALVHLKVETGTHRQGMELAELRQCLNLCTELPALELLGLSSHFANIEDTTHHEFAALQLKRFDEALELARELGVSPRWRHIASSAAAILFPHTRMDLVRLGIAAYGFWPSRETLVSAREKGIDTLDIAPALRWKSMISQVKSVQPGSFIGYGCTYKVEVESRIGVVPVGYGDGYRREMGGRAWVLVRGRRCPVRGRICMNLIMIDVSHVPDVAAGEEVVLLGEQNGEVLSAETLADWAGSIHYEVLAGLSPEIPRVALRPTHPTSV